MDFLFNSTPIGGLLSLKGCRWTVVLKGRRLKHANGNGDGFGEDAPAVTNHYGNFEEFRGEAQVSLSSCDKNLFPSSSLN